MHAVRNWADAVGDTDWRGWPDPLQVVLPKQEAQRRWGHTGRLREPQAYQHSMADLWAVREIMQRVKKQIAVQLFFKKPFSVMLIIVYLN